MLERPDEPVPPELRVSDADRQRIVELLRRHCADGRLTLDEFSERVELVYDARSRGQLEKVTVDLPVDPTPVPEAKRRRVRRWVVGVMGGGSQKGRWRPAEQTNALAIMGGCEIDLRQAEIEHPVLFMTTVAIMGGIDIVVPEGVEVELTGFALMGGKESRVKEVPRLPGSPIIRVRAFAFMGGVTVRNKRPREPVVDQVEDWLDAWDRHKHRHDQRQRGRSGGRSSSPAGGRTRAPAGTVTILFSDIEGFSNMTERLGDRKANEIVRAHNTIVRGQVAEHGGFEVKQQGDGFMVAFDSASKALRCGEAIQRELVDYNRQHPDEPIRVHIGMHTGEAIKEGDDFLGHTVIMASRIANEAFGGEILVSSLLHDLTAATGEFGFGDPRDVELKGLSGQHRVYPLRWAD